VQAGIWGPCKGASRPPKSATPKRRDSVTAHEEQTDGEGAVHEEKLRPEEPIRHEAVGRQAVDEYVVKPDDDRSSATHGVQEPETHRALVERHSLIVRDSDFGRFRRRATPFTPAGLIGSFARALKIARE
jgi:hypothetical protein